MKIKLVLGFLGVILSFNVSAESHTGKQVLTIHSPDNRACTFFRLEGVSQADPVVANNPWFSVPLTHQGHDVIISILLAAYASKAKVSTATTGKVVCGHAEISNVSFFH